MRAQMLNPEDAGVVRTDECWDWTLSRTTAGYSTIGRGPRRDYLHRVAYRAFFGAIPSGLEIDHLCRNPACFNPAHLEAVTHQENMRRGFWGMKTHCPKGHPYDEENTRINSVNGGRECRECVKRRKRKGEVGRSKTHCAAGHERSPENRRQVGNTSLCVPCKNAQNAAYKARKKAES